jgi:hypothetical protein
VLYDPAQFEALIDEPWDEGRMRDGIRAIVADADAAFDPDELWPAEEWDGWEAPHPLKDLYVGASGVLWALDALRRRGFAESGIDLIAASRRTLELWHEAPDYSQESEEFPLPRQSASGLLLGESGPLLVGWRLAPSDELADRLHARVRENVGNEAIEIMWGEPGTMLAARAMLDWTGEERWEAAWQESADSLWATREEDGLWTNRLYGRTFRSLTPPHGLVGNIVALRPDPRREQLERETAEVLARLVVRDDGLANWPGREDSDTLKLQWCSGAPGILAAASSYLDEELVIAGAELIWTAGACGDEKGHGLCHGTSGNGFGLLKAFARSGDERWLERARRFAVHALLQAERIAGANGRRRYSLFTGDVGTALFAAACLDVDARFPIIDAI